MSPATKIVSIFVSLGATVEMMSSGTTTDTPTDPQHSDKPGSPSCYNIGYSNGWAHQELAIRVATAQTIVMDGMPEHGGKTLEPIVISAPNKGYTIDLNTQISASGSNVYVTWWTNKTGTLMPVFLFNGDTFAKAITPNITGYVSFFLTPP